MKTCSLDECDRPSRALGLCRGHYDRRYHGNNSTLPMGPAGVSPGKTVRWPGATRRSRRVWENIEKRCTYKKWKCFRTYGGRGIKNLITPYEIEILWQRDNADQLKKPSIDRIDNDGHYTFGNCRFIEHSENSKRYWADRRISKSRLDEKLFGVREKKAS